MVENKGLLLLSVFLVTFRGAYTNVCIRTDKKLLQTVFVACRYPSKEIPKYIYET